MGDLNAALCESSTVGSLPLLADTPLSKIPSAQSRRVMICAKHKSHTCVTRHFIRGFEENGHVVKWVNFRKVKGLLGARLSALWLRWQITWFKPELFFLYHHDGPWKVFDWVSEDVKKVVFYEDGIPGSPPDPRVMTFALKAGTVFTTARGYVDVFREAGVSNVHYLRTGCDRTDHYPVSASSNFESDIAFIGGPRLGDRTEILKRISEKHKLAVYGQDWEEAIGARPRLEEIYPEEYRGICSSAKIIIGMDPRDDLDLYFSNRTWLSLACGGFLLTRYVPNLEEHFTNHEHLVWYHSPEECLELIDYYLPREEERRRIARNGSEYVREYHTFRHATAELMAASFPNP